MISWFARLVRGASFLRISRAIRDGDGRLDAFFVSMAAASRRWRCAGDAPYVVGVYERHRLYSGGRAVRGEYVFRRVRYGITTPSLADVGPNRGPRGQSSRRADRAQMNRPGEFAWLEQRERAAAARRDS